jgi:ferric-dicitrate binding protein FerR (iron transport regulator)
MRTFPENMDPDLLVAFLSKETSPEETILVKEWIASSEENNARFEALEKVWNASETTFPQAAEVDTEKAWQQLAGKIEKYETGKPQIGKVKASPTLFLKYALRAAAVFIPLLVAGYLIFSHYSKPELLSIVTTDSISEKTLTDGSMITLNQNSELKYPEKFENESREVSLTGEAFFKVSSNPEKPFIIHSGVVDVKVVGTSFNVSNYNEISTIEVFVKEGKVIVFAVNQNGEKTDSIFLEAGSKGIFDKKTSLLRKAVQADGSELFWINQTLIFNKTPLETVFDLVAEIYNVEIIMKNSEIGNLRLTTSFVGQPIDSVMNVIAESFKLKISRNGSTFEIDATEN